MGNQVNFRPSNEVLDALEGLSKRWGLTKRTDVVTRAILEAWRAAPAALSPDLLQKVYERSNAMDIKLDELLELARSVPGVVTIERINPDEGTCRHCGQVITLRPGQPSTSTCLKCVAAGHWQRPGDCRKCAEDAKLAEVRNGDSTAGDRSDIVYDPSQ